MFFEILGFGIIITLSCLNEVIDIPHLFFNAPATPVNVTETIIETTALLIFGIFIIAVTSFLLRKILGMERKRLEMERIFFHDILNIAWGVHLGTTLLTKNKQEKEDITDTLLSATKSLIDEIENQRDLVAAEKNEFKIQPSLIQSKSFLLSIIQLYKNTCSDKGINIVVSPECADTRFESDKALLARIIRNMIKNALEATDKGQDITLGCAADNRNISFWCHNSRYIPENIQKILFKKKYSSKAKNRGIGILSMKLLTERYLQGSIVFTSTIDNGTTFTVKIPITFNKNNSVSFLGHHSKKQTHCNIPKKPYNTTKQ